MCPLFAPPTRPVAPLRDGFAARRSPCRSRFAHRVFGRHCACPQRRHAGARSQRHRIGDGTAGREGTDVPSIRPQSSPTHPPCGSTPRWLHRAAFALSLALRASRYQSPHRADRPRLQADASPGVSLCATVLTVGLKDIEVPSLRPPSSPAHQPCGSAPRRLRRAALALLLALRASRSKPSSKRMGEQVQIIVVAVQPRREPRGARCLRRI